MTTNFSNQIEILGEFYQNYKEDKKLKDFLDFNDLGLPLAYFASENLCQISDDGMRYIAETWEMFLLALDIKDEGFTTLQELFDLAEKKE
jgi:hypothetical protein